MYKDKFDYSASSIPPEWHGWLNYINDYNPKQHAFKQPIYQIAAEQSKTGSQEVYNPKGSWFNPHVRGVGVGGGGSPGVQVLLPCSFGLGGSLWGGESPVCWGGHGPCGKDRIGSTLALSWGQRRCACHMLYFAHPPLSCFPTYRHTPLAYMVTHVQKKLNWRKYEAWQPPTA